MYNNTSCANAVSFQVPAATLLDLYIWLMSHCDIALGASRGKDHHLTAHGSMRREVKLISMDVQWPSR